MSNVHGLAIAGALVCAVVVSSEAVEPVVFEDGLDGEAIYARLLENKLSTSTMEQRTISEDQSGDRQESRFWARFRDYRVDGRPDEDGVISKSVMKYTYPTSRRDAGYLFIEKYRTENEGFNYSRARGKVMRMRTSEETVFGTDFTLEDLVAVKVLDEATYERRPDEELDGVAVYVVMVTYHPESKPQYMKSLLWIDKEYFVPLKTLNWAHAGHERNVMAAPRGRIERHGDAWIPMEIVMTDLSDSTSSWLYTDKVEPNPELSEKLFDPMRLGRNRR